MCSVLCVVCRFLFPPEAKKEIYDFHFWFLHLPLSPVFTYAKWIMINKCRSYFILYKFNYFRSHIFHSRISTSTINNTSCMIYDSSVPIVWDWHIVIWKLSQSVSIRDCPRTEWSSALSGKICFFAITSTQTVQPTQSHIQWIPGKTAGTWIWPLKSF
jgi:hypothetical protein